MTEKGAVDGSLLGVPISVKDLIDVADVRTTFGARVVADNVTPADGPSGRRQAVMPRRLNAYFGEDPIELSNAEFHEGAGAKPKSAVDNAPEMLDPAVAAVLGDVLYSRTVEEDFLARFRRFDLREQSRGSPGSRGSHRRVVGLLDLFLQHR